MGHLLVLLRLVHVVKPCPKDLHGLVLVLELGLLVLTADDKSGRLVCNAHCRVGGVNALTAGPARTIDVDFEVFGIDFNLHILRLGQHGDRRG